MGIGDEAARTVFPHPFRMSRSNRSKIFSTRTSPDCQLALPPIPQLPAAGESLNSCDRCPFVSVFQVSVFGFSYRPHLLRNQLSSFRNPFSTHLSQKPQAYSRWASASIRRWATPLFQPHDVACLHLAGDRVQPTPLRRSARSVRCPARQPVPAARSGGSPTEICLRTRGAALGISRLHQHHRLQPGDCVLRRIRVNRGHRSGMSSVHRLQHVDRLIAPAFADDNPVEGLSCARSIFSPDRAMVYSPLPLGIGRLGFQRNDMLLLHF